MPLSSSLFALSAISTISQSVLAEPPAPYNESMAVIDQWLIQATDCEGIDGWTCGRACDEVPVTNVRVMENKWWATMGVAAHYGEDCLLIFRGTKNIRNWLEDAWFFTHSLPDDVCPGCKVHAGIYGSWTSLRNQTFSQLADLGCRDRKVQVIGHSLGAALAVFAGLELVEQGYSIDRLYTYGQPRIANTAWVSKFTRSMQNTSYFRVVNYMDAVPHLIPRAIMSSFEHPGPQVYYRATRLGSYIVVGAESPEGSNQHYLWQVVMHTCDHCSYLGMNNCRCGKTEPMCMEPLEAPQEVNSDDDLVSLLGNLKRAQSSTVVV